jgi:hypothetical protein
MAKLAPLRSPPPDPAPCAHDQLDELILRDLRTQGYLAVHLWSIVEQIVAAQRPPNRSEARRLRSKILRRMDSLTRRKLIERVDRKLIRLCEPTVPVKA